MGHSSSTSTAVVAVPASGPGALAGFEFRCEDCAEVAAFSIRSMTESHARDHVAYMIRAEAGRLRAEGRSLYAIAVELGVTKEWLRERAGVR